MTDVKAKADAKKSSRQRASSSAAARRIFTVRDLNRQPQMVLTAAKKFGEVHVQSRSGERFLVKADLAAAVPAAESGRAAEHLARLRMLQERMKEQGEGFSAKGWEIFSKMIAGD